MELVATSETKERRGRLMKSLHQLALEAGAVMAILIICAVLTLGIILISLNRGPAWVLAVLGVAISVTLVAGAYLWVSAMWREEGQES